MNEVRGLLLKSFLLVLLVYFVDQQIGFVSGKTVIAKREILSDLAPQTEEVEIEDEGLSRAGKPITERGAETPTVKKDLASVGDGDEATSSTQRTEDHLMAAMAEEDHNLVASSIPAIVNNKGSSAAGLNNSDTAKTKLTDGKEEARKVIESSVLVKNDSKISTPTTPAIPTLTSTTSPLALTSTYKPARTSSGILVVKASKLKHVNGTNKPEQKRRAFPRPLIVLNDAIITTAKPNSVVESSNSTTSKAPLNSTTTTTKTPTTTTMTPTTTSRDPLSTNSKPLESNRTVVTSNVSNTSSQVAIVAIPNLTKTTPSPLPTTTTTTARPNSTTTSTLKPASSSSTAPKGAIAPTSTTKGPNGSSTPDPAGSSTSKPTTTTTTTKGPSSSTTTGKPNTTSTTTKKPLTTTTTTKRATTTTTGKPTTTTTNRPSTTTTTKSMTTTTSKSTTTSTKKPTITTTTKSANATTSKQPTTTTTTKPPTTTTKTTNKSTTTKKNRPATTTTTTKVPEEVKDSDKLLAVVMTNKGGFRGRRINSKAILSILRGKLNAQQVTDLENQKTVTISTNNSFVFPAGHYYFPDPLRVAGFMSP